MLVDLDVPDVARAAGHPVVDLAADHDAAPDAGPDLHEEEVVDGPGEPGVQLAERHDVHVVVHQHGAAELLAHRLPHRVAVPAGHDRGRDRYARGEAHRPGQADAGAVDLGGDAPGPQLAEQLARLAEDGGRAVADVGRGGDLPEHLQLAVGHRHVDRGRADVDAGEPQAGRDAHDAGPPSAAGRREPGGLHEPEIGEPVELHGHLGPGQPDDVAELGARARALPAKKQEEPRLMDVLRASCHSPDAPSRSELRE